MREWHPTNVPFVRLPDNARYLGGVKAGGSLFIAVGDATETYGGCDYLFFRDPASGVVWVSGDKWCRYPDLDTAIAATLLGRKS